VRGDLQILDIPQSTFSPVVSWITVRLLFVLTVARGLHSTTIDFNNAFVQSKLPEPIYLELPPGYASLNGSNHVYKVSKSLYGDVRASKLWYKHLRDILIHQLKFTISKIDSCLFIRKGIIFIFYVDDGIIISHDSKMIEHFIAELQSAGLDFGIEDDYAGYLGVEIKPNEDGSLLLSQTGLIERIIADLGLTNSPSHKSTPVMEVLSHFSSSPPFDDTYNYRSVLGKLMYLSANTRCELSFANHQCARFSINPRKPHGTALKRIGRYLLGTRDKGTIVRPTDELTLDCYADADFAGLFASSDPEDPKSVRSRTGFVILLGTTPIAWVSKLQSETALSTMESEYIALSQSLRVLLPLRQLLQEVSHTLGLSIHSNSLIQSTIFEDNQACYQLATSDPPRMTPRSKSIAIKYHWFREHLRPGEVEIKPIPSQQQLADIFTKPLSPVNFERLRNQLLGW
jgi:Reverse transcriptase (RNA-dependent DNA polymerase)